MVGSRTRSTLFALLLILVPMAFFVGLRFIPDGDPAFEAPLFHFYIVTFTSFVGLVAALFLAAATREAHDPRILFITLGFAGIAAIFLHHGLATPGIVIQEFNLAVVWSAPLSLGVGAVFFALSTIRWRQTARHWIVSHQGLIWLAAGILYIVYMLLAYQFTGLFALLSQMEPWFEYGLTAIAAMAYFWAAAFSFNLYSRNRRTFDGMMGVALVLLGEAQILMAVGPVWLLSWWGYHLLMVAGFLLAMFAIAAEYEGIGDFRPARYFAALGGVAVVGLAFLAGEITVQVFDIEDMRLPIMALVLIVSSTLFVVLYAIVLRADRLIRERTAALNREQAMRRDLTDLIIHDLKNPLSAIVGSLSALIEGSAGELNESQQRFLVRSEQATQDALHLIDDVLDVERLEAGVLVLHRELFEMGGLLDERVQAFEGLAAREGHEVNFELPKEMQLLDADRVLIARVIDNLLSNAVKYTPANGSITVRSTNAISSVQVSVADSGPGIPFEEREHIFEKYGQVSGTERRGAGLGLTFCMIAIEAHAGSIAVDDRPGGGAVFTFSLPTSAES